MMWVPMSPSVPEPDTDFLKRQDSGVPGIGRPILLVVAAEGQDIADASLVDQLLGQDDCRRVPIVVRHHVSDAGFLDSVEHRPCLVGVARQRFLADDVLAGLRRRDCDLRMAVVRRADVDDVDVVALDDILPARRKLLELQAISGSRGQVVADVDDHLANRQRGRFEVERHGGIGKRMSLAHEARPNHCDIEFLHDVPPKIERSCPAGAASKRHALFFMQVLDRIDHSISVA